MTRKLTEDDARLWSAVVRSVRPLRPSVSRAAGANGAHQTPHASVAPLPAGTGTPASDPRPATSARLAARPARPAPPPVPALAPLNRRDARRLGRGVIDIDGRLDLHGMTQDQAHAALLGFLHAAQGRGARYVLVITGKGDGEGFSRGVLRRQVPHWLQLPEFRACVTSFDAATGHGGAGALYVRIRRRR